MNGVVNPGDMELSVDEGKTAHGDSVSSEEARQAAPAQAPEQQTTEPQNREKENKWKLAFRQLMFMKRMNMQFNDRTKNEIELRQQNISVSFPRYNLALLLLYLLSVLKPILLLVM